ncbi:hypothetical protein Lsha_1309 [Legionella shakespearei DSM 23087]|uniref:Uncharacterized protein n=1 Tax=Legionella shakespearei DSM 23087 TaxID=1122169 RepID=A0A0W0YX41_9GAMM|nr:hypothetical protein Lsha_1309 [Legionella shakespearei DSM 23087]
MFPVPPNPFANPLPLLQIHVVLSASFCAKDLPILAPCHFQEILRAKRRAQDDVDLRGGDTLKTPLNGQICVQVARSELEKKRSIHQICEHFSLAQIVQDAPNMPIQGSFQRLCIQFHCSGCAKIILSKAWL